MSTAERTYGLNQGDHIKSQEKYLNGRCILKIEAGRFDNGMNMGYKIKKGNGNYEPQQMNEQWSIY